MLIDYTRCSAQSQPVVERARRGNRETFDQRDRLAIIVDGALARMRLQRLISHNGSAICTDRSQTLLWLEIRSKVAA